MSESNKHVSSFQKNLDKDADEKRHFIDAEESSESDSEDGIRVVPPRRNRKTTIDAVLVEQLTNYQAQLLKAQRKICDLRTTNDTEEVKSRYLKLDLNNAQVDAQDSRDKLKKVVKKMRTYELEMWSWRIIVTFYIFWSMYTRFMSFWHVDSPQ
jgi:hypothetical protein